MPLIYQTSALRARTSSSTVASSALGQGFNPAFQVSSSRSVCPPTDNRYSASEHLTPGAGLASSDGTASLTDSTAALLSNSKMTFEFTLWNDSHGHIRVDSEGPRQFLDVGHGLATAAVHYLVKERKMFTEKQLETEVYLLLKNFLPQAGVSVVDKRVGQSPDAESQTL
ncbi:hypothetical protein M231_08086 [Tremella mesenterica]|uniref:Uncharacterized protein n=1 Tax=Tremella mesenterica TaxID=5217 RepID=A0A4Q1B9N2_TREME|nr:hypothetical protein M231_08086 [Tremella mesenterica]